jgi:hypothetical protein
MKRSEWQAQWPVLPWPEALAFAERMRPILAEMEAFICEPGRRRSQRARNTDGGQQVDWRRGSIDGPGA